MRDDEYVIDPVNEIGVNLILDLSRMGCDFFEELKKFFDESTNNDPNLHWCVESVYKGCIRDIVFLLKAPNSIDVLKNNFPIHETVRDILLCIENLDYGKLVTICRYASFPIFQYLHQQCSVSQANTFLAIDVGFDYVVVREIFS